MSKIDIKYHNLLQKILEEGYDYLDESRQVNCKQISSYEFRHNLRTEGFPAISTKKLYWKGVVGELIWFLRGDSHIKYLLDNNINIWNKDGYNFYLKMYEQYPLGKEKLSFDQWIDKQRSKRTEFSGDLGRIYGQQWRKWSDIRKAEDQAYLLGINSYESDVNPEDFVPDTTDQFKDLIQNLKDKPMSRRHLITAWNPAELDQMALPPCHWAFEIIPRPLNLSERNLLNNELGKGIPGVITHEKLDEINAPRYIFDLKWHQRSVDTFLGLPFNIASYGLLAGIIGKLTNMIPNELIGDLSNVHIYEPHIKAVKEQLSRDVNKYENCNLIIEDIKEFYKFSKDYCSIDNLFINFEMNNFKLENYESYSTIQAEMIEPKI